MPGPARPLFYYRAGKHRTSLPIAQRQAVRFVLWMVGFVVAGFAVALLASLLR